MIDRKTARATLQEHMAGNLVIVNEYETPYEWCFGLGLAHEDGSIMPLLGESTIRINKETGEMD